MVDDLDDLLDEIEKDLSSTKKQSKKLKPASSDSLNEDIDAILNDTPDSRISARVQKRPPVNCQVSGTLKCNTLYIGGSKVLSGRSSIASKKACDRMRCTNCDFKVEQFNDYEWADSIDYLFLRNNMPDFRKVAAKLRRSTGSRAYACQCSWKSVKVLTSLQRSDLKWVCGKHQL